MVTTTRASPFSSQSRLQRSPNTYLVTHTTRRRGQEQPPSATYSPLLMNKINRSEGEDKPPSVKRTRRVIPRPTYKTSSACVGMLRCGELVRLRSRAIAIVDHFARTLSEKQSANSGFIARVVHSILPLSFCYPKNHLIFGFVTLLYEMASGKTYTRLRFAGKREIRKSIRVMSMLKLELKHSFPSNPPSLDQWVPCAMYCCLLHTGSGRERACCWAWLLYKSTLVSAVSFYWSYENIAARKQVLRVQRLVDLV